MRHCWPGSTNSSRSMRRCCATCTPPARSGCRSTNRRWSRTGHRRRLRSPPPSTPHCRRNPTAPRSSSRRTSASLGDALPALAAHRGGGRRLSTWSRRSDSVAAVPDLARKHVVAGVVDGRNVWRTDLEAALGTARDTARQRRRRWRCRRRARLLHVPYTLDAETDSTPRCAAGWRSAPRRCARSSPSPRALTRRARRGRRRVRGRPAQRCRPATSDPRLHDVRIRARLDSSSRGGHGRGPAEQRREAQNCRLDLPPLPTTTIGSYPQTGRDPHGPGGAARAARSTRPSTSARMRAEIADVIALQEELGLDVLVHGEPERNDMVQYFAEQLDGFFATDNGWVQSYGTRCVRPPILYGDVSPTAADDRRVDHLRAVADRQAGQGHAHRSGHDPGVVVRPRRPAAGRHRQPGRAGHPRRDRGPAVGRDRDHPGRRARAARTAAAAPRGQVRRTSPGRSARSGSPPPGSPTPPRSTPTCATRSSAR